MMLVADAAFDPKRTWPWAASRAVSDPCRTFAVQLTSARSVRRCTGRAVRLLSPFRRRYAGPSPKGVDEGTRGRVVERCCDVRYTQCAQPQQITRHRVAHFILQLLERHPLFLEPSPERTRVDPQMGSCIIHPRATREKQMTQFMPHEPRHTLSGLREVWRKFGQCRFVEGRVALRQAIG